MSQTPPPPYSDLAPPSGHAPAFPPPPSYAYAAVPPPPPRPPSPWGPWATLGLTVASVLLGILICIPLGVIWFLTDSLLRGEMMNETGASMFAMEISSGVVLQLGMLGGVVLFAWLRRPYGLARYFAFKRVRWTVYGWAFLAIAVWIGLEMGLNAVLQRPVPESMAELLSYPAVLPIVWVLVVVLAPICEEMVFRGFMWRGFITTRLGLHGTALVTCIPWTLLHLGQYGVFDMVLVFITGMILSYARHLSGSLWVPMFMHLVMNLTAMIAVTLYWMAGQL